MKQGRPPKINAGKLLSEYYVDGNITEACKRLKICRKTFYNTMKRTGMNFSKRRIEDNA